MATTNNITKIDAVVDATRRQKCVKKLEFLDGPSHGGYSQLVRDMMMKKDSQPVKLIVNMNELNGKKITTSSGNQIISVIRVISSSTSSVTPTTPKTITVSSSSSTTPTTMSVTPVTVSSSQKNNHHTIVLDDSHLFKTPNKPVTVSVVSTGSKRRKISGSSPASSPSSSDSGVGSSSSGGLASRSLPGVFSAFGATVSSFAGLNSYMSTRSSGIAGSTRIVVSKKVDETPSTASRGKKAGAATAASSKTSAPKAEVETPSKAGRHRYETSLGQLTKKFISLLKEAPEGVLNLNEASNVLEVQKRRIYDITNVLEGVGLLEKTSKNNIRWNGGSLDSCASFLWDSSSCDSWPSSSSSPVVDSSGHPHRAPLRNLLEGDNASYRATLMKENQSLAAVEKQLEAQIAYAQSLLTKMTENEENKKYAYITYKDIRGVKEFSEQTVVAIKAPQETKLEVPDPRESLQIWLKSKQGEIEVYLCPDDENSGEGGKGGIEVGGRSSPHSSSSAFDEGKGESITTVLESVVDAEVSKVKTSSRSQGKAMIRPDDSDTGMKYAFISEDDDLGTIGSAKSYLMMSPTEGRGSSLRRTTNASIVHSPSRKASSSTLHSHTVDPCVAPSPLFKVSSHYQQSPPREGFSTSPTTPSKTLLQSHHNCSNNFASTSFAMSSSSSTAHTNLFNSSPSESLPFMSLEPPLSEEDYNFALEASEGIADLFDEELLLT